MSSSNETGAVEFVRRGARVVDPAKEQVVLLDRNEGLLRTLGIILPIGGMKYVVPRGRLDRSVTLDGSVLVVTIEETGESIQLHPRIRVLGLAESLSPTDAGRTLAAMMHDHEQRQIPRVRALVDDVLRDAVGLRTKAADIDGIATSRATGAADVLAAVRAKVGLEIEWTLDPEPRVAAWFQKLQAMIPDSTTQSFNAQSSTAQFNLMYSTQIVSVVPSRLHLLQRRANAAATPQDELAKVLKRVFVILNPAFGVFGDGSQIWRYADFWHLVRAAFDQVVAPTIADEFGYHVVFRDFRREMTSAERMVLEHLEDPARLTRDFEAAEQFYLALKAQERQTIIENDYDLKAQPVLAIQAAVKHAHDGMESARRDMEAASQGRGMTVGAEADPRAQQLLQSFRETLERAHPLVLQLGERDPSPRLNTP